MNVALCHHYSLTFYGGGERFLIDVANQLIKRGHNAVIYALPFGRRAVNLDGILHNVEYHENFFHNITDADVAYFIYAPLVHNLFIGKTPKIGAIHAFVFLNDLQHTEVKTMSYTTFIRCFGFSRFFSNFYFSKLQKKRLRGFDAIHVINKEALNLFQNEKRVYYVPNWIDTSRFRSVEDKDSKFSVLFIGRRAKGFSMFTEIAYFLRNKDINFIAIGPDLEKVRNVKNLGFITDTKELIKLYSKVHLLVYTSKTDVFPLTLLEAAACKIPIISLPTRAIHGLNLPLFFATSIKEFAQVICELHNLWLTKREQYIKLSEKMRTEAIKYDLKEVFPKFLSMLQEVATLSSN
jgi:glycosyltransferase involved in cell wall biosynthesis